MIDCADVQMCSVQAIDGRTAAVILEPLPATLSIPLPPEGYL